MKFKEMNIGDQYEVPLLLISVDSATTKSGKEYAKVELIDGDESIEAKVWNYTRADILAVVEQPSVVLAELKVDKYNDQKNYVCNRLSPYTGGDVGINDFIITSPIDTMQEYQYLYDLVDMDTVYGVIVRRLLDTFKDDILIYAAAKKNHHNRYGGLLWHTSGIVRSAEKLAEVYPGLEKNLLLSGAILHDIGKVREYSSDRLGNADFTVDGELFGHLFLGAEMVQDAANDLLDDPGCEEVRLLKHCIVSHHGKYEYGAISLPKIPEALIIHYLDMMDSKLYTYFEERTKLQPGTFSDRIWNIDNGKVYRSMIPCESASSPALPAAEMPVKRHVHIENMSNLERDVQKRLQIGYVNSLAEALNIDTRSIWNCFRCRSEEEIKSVLQADINISEAFLEQKTKEVALFIDDLKKSMN